jgi:hypothetical protein
MFICMAIFDPSTWEQSISWRNFCCSSTKAGALATSEGAVAIVPIAAAGIFALTTPVMPQATITARVATSANARHARHLP